MPNVRGKKAPATEARLRAWIRRNRITQRKYIDWSRPQPFPELSVQIDHEGSRWFFPLETSDHERALELALEIRREVLDRGWTRAHQQFAREFTWAIAWLRNPFALTYTSLFTRPLESAEEREPAWEKPRSRCRVALIESDAIIRAALVHWLQRQPGFACEIAVASPAESIDAIRDREIPLVLVNQEFVGADWEELEAEVTELESGIGVFGYGIFADTDELWQSLTDTSGGYFLRRRPPEAMLEPLGGGWGSREIHADRLREEVAQYFLGLLLAASDDHRDERESFRLTSRERQMLEYLRRGYPNKGIAATLGISIWTVHTHIKHLFEKMGVHTRAEAVSRYLEK